MGPFKSSSLEQASLGRRDYLRLQIKIIFSMVFLGNFLVGCGDETTSSDDEQRSIEVEVLNGGNCNQNGSTATMDKHTHPISIFSINANSIVNGVGGEAISLEMGNTGHIHSFIMTAQDWDDLRNNQGILKISGVNNGHAHQVIINCM